MGGSNGDTYYTVFDFDAYNNMAIGGMSNDSYLVSLANPPNAFLLYTTNSSVFLWAF